MKILYVHCTKEKPCAASEQHKTSPEWDILQLCKCSWAGIGDVTWCEPFCLSCGCERWRQRSLPDTGDEEGDSRCPQCEASHKPSLLFSLPTWSSLTAAQPAALTTVGALHCPGHMEGKVSVTSGLEGPRHEQSTARVGPVNTAAFEGWFGKMYVRMYLCLVSR